MKTFDFDLAFSRNLGWVTAQEQAQLRQKRIAIAGLGGVGGHHLLTLTRLGIGAFTIADFDTFELVNFNRQSGATMENLGRPKSKVVSEMAKDINPELDLRVFPKGVDASNVDDFLEGTDLYLDGLDFFELDIRRLVFRRCRERGIPAITAAPFGMGAALVNFLPGKMSFDDYFRMEGKDKVDDQIRFLIGLSPRLLQMPYLVDQTRADFKAQRGPSTSIGCTLCAGMAATEALKILLNRGEVAAAPRGIQFDAYRNRMVRTWRPGGNHHPLQKLAFRIVKQRLEAKRATDAQEPNEPLESPAERVIDLARWAPSGDNLQPWRFELKGKRSFLVRGSLDKGSRSVYFLNDWPNLLTFGGLLETISIAATGERLHAEFDLNAKPSSTPGDLSYRVRLVPNGKSPASPLLPFIRMRTTQRRALSRTPLSPIERDTLEKSVAPYRLLWMETPKMRRTMARLISQYTKIRLTIPEAYEAHRKVIEWNAQYSRDRIPDRALGLDSLSLKLMHWAMGKWSRVKFMNRFLVGTMIPRLELDLIPGLRCAAFVALIAPQELRKKDDYLEAGRIMQRFWLTLTQLGLQAQPQLAPLVFDSYVREKIPFTADPKAVQKAAALSPKLQEILGAQNYPQVAFLCRVGYGKTPDVRSLRKSLSQLLSESDP